MHNINQLAQRAGVPAAQVPYPRITAPKPGVKAADWPGGVQPSRSFQPAAGVAAQLQQLQASKLRHDQTIQAAHNHLVSLHRRCWKMAVGVGAAAASAKEAAAAAGADASAQLAAAAGARVTEEAKARRMLAEAYDMQAALQLFEREGDAVQV